MIKDTDILNKIGLTNDHLEVDEDKKYYELGLKFNPFPRSGTANSNSSDIQNQYLRPVDYDVIDKVNSFIRDALINNEMNEEDRFLSATITGDYGSGKTQLLMYVKFVLGEIANIRWKQKNPFIIYINNPGVKLSELVGSIIDRIGEDSFKKFLWAKLIKEIKTNEHYQKQLKDYESHGIHYPGFNPDPYADENTKSYKSFLDAFVREMNPKKRKMFDERFKKILLDILENEVDKNNILAQYFYNIISEDFGANKTWDELSNGTAKKLDRKEAQIIKYIVKLIKSQGFTDFFILVDEFEDITAGRLTKSQVDNYVFNLRTLLDEHRDWCLMFAMTGQALMRLKAVSPPLSDRITSRLINLQSLNLEQAKMLVNNYLENAKMIESNNTLPFDVTGINKLRELDEGNARQFLKHCFYLVEKAVAQQCKIIDDEFVSKHYTKEI